MVSVADGSSETMRMDVASLSRTDPALEVASVDDPEDEHDSIIGQDVVHDSVVAHAESMERVVDAVDRLDLFAGKSSATGDVACQRLERRPKPSLDVGWELLVRPGRSRTQGDSIRGQASSARSTVAPSE